MFDRAEPIFELPPYEADNPGGCFVEAMYYDIDQPGLEIAAYTEDYYPHWWLLQAESGDIVDSIIDCPLPEINHPFLWYDEEPNYDMAQSTSEIAPHAEDSYPPEWLLQAESGDIADSIIDYALSEINLPLVRSDQEQNNDMAHSGFEMPPYAENYNSGEWLPQAEYGDIADYLIDYALSEINHSILWYDEEPNYDMAQPTSEIAPHSEDYYPPEWLIQAESGDIADSIIDYALSEINLPLVRSDQEQNYEIAQSDLEIAPHAEDYYPSEWVIQAEACGAEEPSVECPIIDMNVASAFNDLPEIFKHVLIKFDMKSFQNNSFSSMRKAEPLLESAFLKD